MATGPGLRERKKQKTRWAIQEHALRLFAQQGYDATTVDQIAAAAEISPSTFFRYFKTKEDVVMEDEYDPMMVEAFLEAPAELTPAGAMRHAMRSLLSAMSEEEKAKILERAHLQLSVPALRARSMETLLSTRDVIGGAVATRTGRDPSDIEVRVFAGAVMGVLIAALLDWHDRAGEVDLADALDAVMAHVETGLAL